MNTELILTTHRQRQAIIYVRQSSPNQVNHHQESTRLQYALKKRALERGWPEQQILVIDEDLGRTGSNASLRPGFQRLVTQVSLGQVGIVFAYDATRLARNCTDWYQLLDLCGLRQCLVGDQDGVYDPATPNGRLLLGLKGLIAELELHTLKARLLAGMHNKAQRGELPMRLPVGLVRLESGEVVKHPDREVQDRIALVFRLLLEMKTLASVARHLRKHQLKLPRNDFWNNVQWKPADVGFLSEMVHNPAYAGAYVWGRTRMVQSPRTGRTHGVNLPRQQWRVCLRDRLPAYISWEEFERIESMLQDNHAEYKRNRTRGIPRDGKNLLQGIAYCGVCGHKMGVQYKRQSLYLCHFFQQHGGKPCQRLPSESIDTQVVRWFMDALSVAEIDLSARALAEADRHYDQLLSARRQELERLQYQARLSERQFQRSDPDNRLVTAELERRWEESLRACQEAEARLQIENDRASALALPDELVEALEDLGRRLPEYWQQDRIATAHKKALLRTLIDKVVLHRVASDQVCIRVIWRGGDTTKTNLRIPVPSFACLSDRKQLDATLTRMAKEGSSDEQIAAELNAQGHRAADNEEWSAARVQRYRLSQQIYRHPHGGRPRCHPGFLTISQMARKLQMSYSGIYRYISEGKLKLRKDEEAGIYLFPDKPATLTQIRQLVQGEIPQLNLFGGHQDA